ncbi:sensor histidine kinase [Aurantiacibacter flavus]|uniref:histidine kinase n=1 Tax=Aurantiacibacter flavus TaxID=3145232 RepID=A0ABV0CS03_9SPHN
MERTLSRKVPIPILAALTMALATTLAVALVTLVLWRIDTTARELRAAENAEREYAELVEKLPGLGEDREMAGLALAALGDLGAVARENGQARYIAVNRAAAQEAGWPSDLDPLAPGYVRFRKGGEAYAGVVRGLGDDSEVLVAYRVASIGPLTQAFWRWGAAIVAVIVAITGLVAWITGAAISRRIARLNALCERVGEGEVTARHPVTTNDELGTLATHMNAMLDELQRRLEALRDTADGLAHDLRTPLARVQARLSRLEDLLGDTRSAAEVRLASEELARLMEAFNALLELREIETQGVFSVQPFDVAKAIEDAIELYEAVAEEERDVRIVRELGECRTMGSASLVVRAVANLLDNALKVSPEGATIRVTLACREDAAVIRVADEGPGVVTLSDQPQRSTLGGHGIGLRIVRAVTRQHGGSFSLANGEKGALAELVLPRRTYRQVS